MKNLEDYFSSNRKYLIAVLSLIVLSFLLHHKALEGNWGFDDGEHLRFASSYSPWQYFFDPAVLIKQTYAHITPWNPFFYDIGLHFFGFSPTALYWMQLCVISASAVAIIILLKNWIGLFPAWIAAAFFLLGVPAQHAAHSIMLGHYTSGLLWSLLCMIFFQKALSGKFSFLFLALAAFSYSNAALCKELYVPLPLVLFFWPGLKGWRDRIYWLWPFIVLGSIYVVWRKFILGSAVGGYGQTLVGVSSQESFLNFFQMLGSFYGVKNLTAVFFIYAIKIIFFIFVFKKIFTKQDWLRFLAIAASLMLPIVITITNGTFHLIGPRILFAFWVGLAVAISFFVYGLITKENSRLFRFLGFFILIIFGALAAKGQYNDWKSLSIYKNQWNHYYSSYLQSTKSVFIIDEKDFHMIDYINMILTGAWEAREKINNSSNLPPLVLKNSPFSLALADIVDAKNRNDVEFLNKAIKNYNQSRLVEKSSYDSSSEKLIIQNKGNSSQNFIAIQRNHSKIVWNFSADMKSIYILSKKLSDQKFAVNKIPNSGELIIPENQLPFAKIQILADADSKILMSDEISLDFDGRKEILFSESIN